METVEAEVVYLIRAAGQRPAFRPKSALIHHPRDTARLLERS
jgi:hypothetical protein